MNATADMMGHPGMGDPDRIRGAFFVALALHAALVGGFLYSGWLDAHKNAFGAHDAGGASVGIEAVNSIPIPHTGPKNPLASDTDSQVPQAPPKPVEKVKEEKPPPDAIALKSRTPKKPAPETSEKNKYRPPTKLDLNQIYSSSAPAVSNPAFSASGAGRVGAGPNTTIGNRCPGYSAQIQQLVASHWNTSDIDPSIRTANTVIATFELLKDGTTRNIHILQGSGIAPVDSSVQRAIEDASPLPKISEECGVDHASAEFWFELKR
ncbi:MAG TPA: TonB family protein [Bryobacteraceae bacterium]